MVSFANGFLAHVEGSWNTAIKHCEQAERIFREQCTGSAWELAAVNIFRLESMLFVGRIADLRNRLSALMKQAEDRGDLFLLVSAGLNFQPFTELVGDDPVAAQRTVSEWMSRWPQRTVHIQHVVALRAELWIDLYMGQGTAAQKRITDQWPTLKRSLTLRMAVFRISMHHLRACSALAAATTAPNPKPLLRAAERDAWRLEGENVKWATTFAQLLRAGVAARRGNFETAVTLMSSAERHLRDLEMGLWAAAARRRVGELTGGKEGLALIEGADNLMTTYGVRNPKRMADLLVPGMFDRFRSHG
jgi:hypothetical protein